MKLFLSVEGSLDYWRSDAPYYGDNLLVGPDYSVTFDNCANSLWQIEAKPFVRIEDGPLEVLVSRPNDVRQKQSFTTRLITHPLPDGSFYAVYRDVFVCSPELIFLLAAPKLQLRSLITLGCELCGTYSIFSETSTAIKHAQICSVESIGEYLDKVPGMHGVALARKALPFVADNSRSPRETDVYMQYCLPPRYGGFGFAGVSLNHEIPVEECYRGLTNMDHITPDLYWPKHKLAIEYESTQDHGAYASSRQLLMINQRKLASDSRRRRTYEAMGITAVTVTNGEFMRFNEVERIAKLLARRMGKHGIASSTGILFRRTELHEWLKVPVEKRRDVL